MSRSSHKPKDKDSASTKSNIAMLVFGMCTLMYLVAIDHADWFILRPISAGAVAVSHASDHAATPARADGAGVRVAQGAQAAE